MAERTIDITIRAKDQASGAIAGVSGKLGALGDIAKTGLGFAMGGILNQGLGMVTTQLGSVFSSAMEAEDIAAKLDQVLKSTGGAAGVTAEEANALAAALSQVTKFEDDNIVEAETMLLRYKNIGEKVFPEATATTLDLAEALGIDSVSAAKLLGKALETPGEGLLRLKQAGVAFSDEQAKMIQAMYDSGDVAGAQRAIMDELAKSIGGTAEAAGTTASGKMAILGNAFGNFKEMIGGPLVDALTWLMDRLFQLGTVVGPVVTEWANNIGMVFTAISPTLQVIGQFIWDWLLLPLRTLLQLDFMIIQAAFGLLRDAIGWVADRVGELFAKWTEQTGGMSQVSDFINGTLVPAFNTVWSFIQANILPILQTLGEWLGIILLAYVQSLADTWNNILAPALAAVWSFISDNILPILLLLGQILLNIVVVAVMGLYNGFVLYMLPALKTAWEFLDKNVIPIFVALADKLKGPVGTALGTFKTLFVDPLGAAFKTVFGVIGDMLGALKELLQALANATLPSWLQRKSPSPLEQALMGSAKAMRDLNSEMNRSSLVGGFGIAGGGGGSSYTLNLYSSAPTENVVADFNMLRSLAGS